MRTRMWIDIWVIFGSHRPTLHTWHVGVRSGVRLVKFIAFSWCGHLNRRYQTHSLRNPEWCLDDQGPHIPCLEHCTYGNRLDKLLHFQYIYMYIHAYFEPYFGWSCILRKHQLNISQNVSNDCVQQHIYPSIYLYPVSICLSICLYLITSIATNILYRISDTKHMILNIYEM
jgi:hypothetical protein